MIKIRTIIFNIRKIRMIKALFFINLKIKWLQVASNTIVNNERNTIIFHM